MANQKLCTPYLDAVSFLNTVSQDDFSQYCLAFAFTSRDFNDGTLGLAWLASKTGAGGLCEAYDGTKSLNTGIVTIVNYNARVPDLMSKLSFVHEVGHAFGAPHDPDSCTPGNTRGGNYIMYSRANTGSYTNNRVFSNCSSISIGRVLDNLASNSKFCFKGKKINHQTFRILLINGNNLTRYEE